jgi:serine/threonine protein phosphatase PrpC
MTAYSTTRLVSLAERLYRYSLVLYPASFRRAYSYEMLQTFREASRETVQEEGNAGLWRFYGQIAADLFITSCRERSRSWLTFWKALVFPPEPAALAFSLAEPLRLQIARLSDIGRVRSANQDNLLTVLPEDPHLLQQKGALFIVADGMGGHTHGERASELAVTIVRERYYADERADVATILVQAIQQACSAIYAESTQKQTETTDSNKLMGTTCLAAALQVKSLTVANVGDSRAYVIHNGQMRQISRDHSLVADMVLAGEITAEEARHHEKRNVIYRALGTAQEVEVDVFQETVVDGDTLLFCTDGLSGLVTEDEILQVIQTLEPEASVQELIARANAAGGTDNITAIVVRVENEN